MGAEVRRTKEGLHMWDRRAVDGFRSRAHMHVHKRANIHSYKWAGISARNVRMFSILNLQIHMRCSLESALAPTKRILYSTSLELFIGGNQTCVAA